MFYQNSFPQNSYFCGSQVPTVERELGEIISKCVIKILEKYKNLLILVSGKLSTNVYAINACFAEIAASN